MQFLHVDAENSAYFNRQLEVIKAQTYDEKPLPLKGLTLVPMTSNTPAGADLITYRSFKLIGIAKFISDYASGNIPSVDTIGTETSQKIKTFADKFSYSIQELAQASMNNVNLPARKAIGARNMVEQLLNRTVLLGDSNFGLRGVLNFPGITAYTVLADGTGSSKLWSTKTPDQIIRDMRGLINAVYISTNGVETPNTFLMSQANYTYISTVRMGTANDTTILEFAKRNFTDITRWDWLPELATASATAGDRLYCGVFDNQHIEFEVPVPFTMLPPQPKSLAFEVPCYGRTAGVLCYYPLAFAYGDIS